MTTHTIPCQQILVVDDEPTVRQSIQMRLTHEGYHVEAVSSGQQALEKLDKRNYDLVVTDHVMPGMSGEELARAIKKESHSDHSKQTKNRSLWKHLHETPNLVLTITLIEQNPEETALLDSSKEMNRAAVFAPMTAPYIN